MKYIRNKFSVSVAALFLACAGAGASVQAEEVKVVTVAQQYGLSYLPLMLMQDQGLLEEEAKKLGLGDIEVRWSTFAGGNVMNDAILSGDLHFATGGVGPFVTLWSRTVDNIGVKAVSAMNSMPLFLNTRNPDIETIADFTDQDRIALPAVRVSIQAITLQMAAEQEFGEGNAEQLNKLTVTQSHPDGMAALLSGHSEINSHFTSPPFQYVELEQEGIRTVLNSYDVTGGPHTFNLAWTSERFVEQNPKTYEAFRNAFTRAINLVSEDTTAAAELYVRVANAKEPVSFYENILNSPEVEFTTTPKNMMKYVDFMYSIGFIKVKPDSWKDMFFANMHDQEGS